MGANPAFAPKVQYIKSPHHRPKGELSDIEAWVRGIIGAVRDEGDHAIRRYSKAFDGFIS